MARFFAFVARLLVLRFLLPRAKSLLRWMLSPTNWNTARLKLILRLLERFLKRNR